MSSNPATMRRTASSRDDQTAKSIMVFFMACSLRRLHERELRRRPRRPSPVASDAPRVSRLLSYRL
jgi:hypothetical protein